MNVPISAAMILTACIAWPAHAAVFTAGDYQGNDGAITVQARGDRVDPYFATRALLTARSLGLDVSEAADAWIQWLLPHQQRDGGFARYCRTGSGSWRTCARADADDAMAALWLELLYVEARTNELPSQWRRSADLSESHLDALFDSRRHVYRVFGEREFALLMDNVEIFGALTAIAERQRAFGRADLARQTTTRAQRLARAIDIEFWDPQRREYRVSTEPGKERGFYPKIVAQIYPSLFGMSTPLGDPRAGYAAWMRTHRDLWLSLRADEYPWGLVAVAAYRMNDIKAASCWLARAASLRHGERWNVLEEAVYQGLSSAIARPLPGDNCASGRGDG
jgi:hypothetical protein